ncbi:MAG: methyltransferase domain-containing protein [Pyrinomonadaceae bacterium]|nr:methyltransferase domain-containing protein [Sphingobacteriaceae bacterium]
MQQEQEHQHVISYYNEHVQHKLNDFIEVNPRIESAWKTLLEFAPQSPLSILEIGCGIGSVSHRMNNQWPAAKVKGVDISTLSIEIANKLFSNSQTTFLPGILKQGTFTEQFDLIVLMDVYEHISTHDRAEVHASLKKILKNKGRIFLSVPTPHYLKWLEKNKPENIQPVDEYISFNVIGQLAAATDTEVLSYQVKNIWSMGDYAHIVLEKNDDFEASFFSKKAVSFKQRGFRGLNKIQYKIGSILRRSLVKKKLK